MKAVCNSLPGNRVIRSVLWLLITCLGLANTLAQAEEADPASRVARVSYLKGEVYTQTTDDDDWATAKINQPLTSGDRLWTDGRGRAELQIGSATMQIDANTQLQLLELSDDVAQIQVTQGVVNVRVRTLSKRDTVEIDTPNAAISVMEAGTYRVEVPDNEDLSVVQVRAGSVDVAGEQQEYTVRDNEQLVLRGSRGSADFDDLGRMDEFDRWAAERNQRADRVVSSRYVGPDVIGYEDLDDYGNWRWYNDYGYVWMPTRINTGWAPYRYGHWAWISPWGWTWIDDAPWGFAPFHYGRWTTIGTRWCWVPGPRTVRAVYAPALVAWIGTPGLSVSVSVGAQPVGWIPLGPREIYRPVYRASHNYVTNVNISNSRLDQNEFERGFRRQPHEVDYANRGAASVVRADAFRNARPIRDQLIRPADRALQPLTTAPVARPERGGQAGLQRTAPPLTPNTRQVLARRQPNQPVISNDDAGRSADLRVIEPTASRRNLGNRGTGPEVSRDNRDPRGGDNQRAVRDLNRSPDTTNREPPERNSRSVITTPSIRSDINRDQRDARQRDRNILQSTPSMPSAPQPAGVTPPSSPQQRDAPAADEPRIRSYSRGVETPRSSDRRNRGPDAGVESAPQRGRSVTMPSTPAPVQRSEPAQTAPAPSTPPANNSNSDRRRDNQDEDRRPRGFRGNDR